MWATIIGVPIGLAALIFGAIQVLSGGSEAQSSPKGAQLELVDALVKETDGNSRLELTLHNTGDRRVVLSEALVKIGRVYPVGHCLPQGDLPLSNTYGLPLPVDAPPGSVMRTPLHQQLGADEADRFGILLGLAGAGGKPLRHNYIFELDLSLVNDGPQSPAPIGRALVSLPEAPTPGEDYWTSGMPKLLAWEFDLEDPSSRRSLERRMRCWTVNAQMLNSALAAPGVRSERLDEVAASMTTPSMAAVEAAEARQQNE